MHRLIILLAVFLLASCAGAPPKPPLPEGEYRPINRQASPEVWENFEFTYRGDILGALDALKKAVPQIEVLPPIGDPVPAPIEVQIRRGTLEDALRAIGEQGERVFEVVLNTTRLQKKNQVFIRFRTSDSTDAYRTQ